MDSLFDLDKVETTPSEQAAAKMAKVKVQSLLKKELMFFTALGLPLETTFTQNHPLYKTAATNGKNVLWDIDFLNSLSVADALFVYIHECAHIAYDHVTQMHENYKTLDMATLNAAQDFRINYDLKKLLNLSEVPVNGYYDDKYDESWTSMMIYNDLVQNNFQPPPQPNNHIDPTKPVDPAQQMSNIARAAAVATAAGAGDSIPAEIQKAIERFYKPKINTMRLLSRYFTEKVKKGINPLKSNKRFGELFVPVRESVSSAKVAGFLDVSGSVSDGEINVFLNEWSEAIRSARVKEITLGQFSTNITDIRTVKSVKDLQDLDITGRGGTNIVPVMEWVKKNKPKVCLIFTDGGFSMPPVEELPKTPIIWCIHNNPLFKAPIGQVVHYDADS